MDIPIAEIRDIYQDDNQNIWIVLSNNECYYFNESLQKSPFNVQASKSRVFQIQDQFYLLKKNTVKIFSKYYKALDTKIISGKHINVKLSKDSIVYLQSTINGPENNTKISMLNANTVDSIVIKNQFFHFYHDCENYYTIGGDQNNLFRITNLSDGKIKFEKKFEDNSGFLKAPIKDGNHNYYIPSTEGILKLSLSKFPFNIIRKLEAESNRFITSYQDSILFFTTYQGSRIYNLNSKKFIYDDFESYLGLTKIDDNNLFSSSIYKTFYKFKFRPDFSLDRSNISDKNINGQYNVPFYDNEANVLWIGTENSLRYIENYSNNLKELQSSTIDIESSQIRCFYKFKDSILIGSHTGIFELYKDKSIKKLATDKNIKYINDLVKTNHGDIYMATQRTGIVILRKNGDVEYLQKDHGMPDNTIYSIEIDDSGFIWCGTQKGLAMINPDNDKINSFFVKDGLPDNEFNYSASHKANNGDLFFGTIRGICHFNPEKIRENIEANFCNIILTDLQLWNPSSQTFANAQIPSNNKIEIPSNSKSVKLSLSLDQVSQIKRDIFQYKIPGLFDTWRSLEDNEIELTNLNPGTYELDIRTKSSIAKELQYSLVVKEIFYTTWWFILTLIILSYLLVRYYNKYKTGRLLQNEKRLEEEVSQRTNEIEKQKTELEQSNKDKDQLISILAHDLRSPLLSLNNVSEKLSYLIKNNRKEDIINLGKDISKKTNSLQRLVDNMLHWSLKQKGRDNSVYNNFLIDGPMIDAIELLKVLAEDKFVEISYSADSDYSIYSDLNAFQTVLRNLLDNAVKYSDKSSTIYIKATRKNDRLIISFKNKMNKDSEVFELQNLGDEIILSDISQGTGLGLSICKYLVEKEKGILEFDTKGKIFTATISYPISDTDIIVSST